MDTPCVIEDYERSTVAVLFSAFDDGRLRFSICQGDVFTVRVKFALLYSDTDSIAKYVRFPRFYDLIRCSVIRLRQRGWDMCRVNLVNARISQSRTRREIQGTSRWWYAWRRDGRRSKDRVL